KGIKVENIGNIPGRTVVVTAGTALGGRIHIGSEVISGGGGGRPASDGLSASLRKLGFELRRLKTGTPPRLHARSIDWPRLEFVLGDTTVPFLAIANRRSAGALTVSEVGMFHVEH